MSSNGAAHHESSDKKENSDKKQRKKKIQDRQSEPIKPLLRSLNFLIRQ